MTVQLVTKYWTQKKEEELKMLFEKKEREGKELAKQLKAAKQRLYDYQMKSKNDN